MISIFIFRAGSRFVVVFGGFSCGSGRFRGVRLRFGWLGGNGGEIGYFLWGVRV